MTLIICLLVDSFVSSDGNSISYFEDAYEIVLKSGKHRIYKVICNLASCSNDDVFFVYEEKK